MNTLIVTVGSSELPINLAPNCEILHINLSSDATIPQGFEALNTALYVKSAKEVLNHSLYKKIIYIHTDFVDTSTDLTVFHEKSAREKVLYSNSIRKVQFGHKQVYFPSPVLWMCSSTTFNILGGLRAKHFDRAWVHRYMVELQEEVGLEHEFFNILGAFHIDIQEI